MLCSKLKNLGSMPRRAPTQHKCEDQIISDVSPEQRVPQDHPLRPLGVMTDEALQELQPRFNRLYAKTGRPSIAPEKLLRALLLQAPYSVRSEWLLVARLQSAVPLVRGLEHG
jgi:transposase